MTVTLFIRRAPLFTALAVFFLLPAFATGHELPIERSALFQIGRSSMELMVVYSEAPGERSEMLVARYDLNQNGRIDGDEISLAAPELTKRAFAGLSITIDGAPLRGAAPDVKVSRGRSGELVVAFYLSERLDPASGRLLAVDVASKKGVVPLQTVVEAGEGMTLLKAIPGKVRGDETAPLTLGGGDTLRVVFVDNNHPN